MSVRGPTSIWSQVCYNIYGPSIFTVYMGCNGTQKSWVGTYRGFVGQGLIQDRYNRKKQKQISAASSGRLIGQQASSIYWGVKASYSTFLSSAHYYSHVIHWAMSDKASLKDAQIRTHRHTLSPFVVWSVLLPPSTIPFSPMLSVCLSSGGLYIYCSLPHMSCM